MVNAREFLRIDEVLRIEEAAKGSPNAPQITRAMARHHGFALLPLIDEYAALGDGEWHQAVAAVSREANEAVARICSALSDGTVTADEIRDSEILEEIDEAIGALARLRGLADRASKGGGR